MNCDSHRQPQVRKSDNKIVNIRISRQSVLLEFYEIYLVPYCRVMEKRVSRSSAKHVKSVTFQPGLRLSHTTSFVGEKDMEKTHNS
jgi:hypothetical protein